MELVYYPLTDEIEKQAEEIVRTRELDPESEARIRKELARRKAEREQQPQVDK